MKNSRSEQFSVCVLLYGENLDLARRCLNSIYDSLAEEVNAGQYVYDFRIGLNQVGWKTDVFVTHWAAKVSHFLRLSTLLYRPHCNAFKYPLMRRMFYDAQHPPAPLLMWFDDDSYLDGQRGWWSKAVASMNSRDLGGFVNWMMPVRGDRWNWVRSQPWYREEAGLPPKSKKFGGKPTFRFPQGAWWMLRRDTAWKFQYPFHELRHCGGDSLLGELARQQDFRQKLFTAGVHVNADKFGNACKSPRRGLRETDLGTKFDAQSPPNDGHQEFLMLKSVIGEHPSDLVVS